MSKITGSIAFIALLGAVACGKDGGTTDGGGGESGERRVISRQEVPDGRFKPKNLESAINDMIGDLETSGITDDYSVGVVLKELTNFWRPVAVGASRAISELEVIGAVQGTTREELDPAESIEEQIGFLQEQIDQEADALVIAPHGDDLIPPMNTFSESGAPIVTIDSDISDTERAIYVGTDNVQGGKTGGETLVEVLDGATGRVIVLGNTDPAWTGGFARTNSAAEVLEAAGNSVEILNSLWVPTDEVTQIADAIADDSSGKPLVGMLGVFANAHALATAAVDAELTEMPKIVAFDFEPDTLSYMQDGIIAATHVQRQYYMGYMSVYVVTSLKFLGVEKTKQTLGDLLIDGYHLDTGLDIIRAEDLDDYNAFIDDLGI